MNRRIRAAGGRRGALWPAAALVLAGCLGLAGCSNPPPGPRPTGGPWPSTLAPSPDAVPGSTPSGSPATGPGAPDHVMIVVFENKAAQQIDGSAQAPYLDQLASHSAVYTNLHAITHPSQPNYIALFSGSAHGVTSDNCPVNLAQPNLGRQLLDTGRTFTGYSEALPRAGYTGCGSGRYARKHNPWVDFTNLPAAVNQPASALPADYAKLPTVSFLVPDLCNDMHDCPVANGDAWAQRVLDPYARWALTHNSLLIVTFDEDDRAHGNRIFTLLCGARVTPGRYGQALSLYSLLGTVEHWYGLPLLGGAATAALAMPTWGG